MLPGEVAVIVTEVLTQTGFPEKQYSGLVCLNRIGFCVRTPSVSYSERNIIDLGRSGWKYIQTRILNGYYWR